MITNQKSLKLADMSTPYLTGVEQALEEAHETVRVLTNLRSTIKRDVFGEDPSGLQKVMGEAGMNVDEEKAIADISSGLTS